MPKLYIPRVIFQPESYEGMQRGINQMANAIRPTLGPLPRPVAIERALRHRTPELLDSGAVIAQRLLEFPNRTEDMGAMFLRHVIRHVNDQAGDGTATAAILLQAVYNEGLRYLAAGGNAMRLRTYLEQGTREILAELNTLTIHLEGEEALAQIAEAICHDPPLAELIGEIFDIIGEYGRLEVIAGHGRGLEREYVEGLYWPSGLIAREMITDFEKLRTPLKETAILLTNLDIEDANQLVPVIEATKQAGLSALLILANKLSNEATALLLANTKPDEFQAIAIKTPGTGGTKQTAALQDLVRLTGGTIFLKGVGDVDFDKIKVSDLGQVRKAWADQKNFGVVGGKGDPRALRKHIAALRAAYKRANDQEERHTLQQRIGKLISGSAVLSIGGSTNAEIKARKESAERTCDTVRGAMINGVLPGGGVGLLACRTKLRRRLEQAQNSDERAAYTILLRAVEEPIRALAANAGHEPSEVLAKINRGGLECGFDVRSGQVVNIRQAGIFDSAKAQKTAVQSAIASAALALTTEVLVQHKNPKPPAEQGPGDYWYRSRTTD